MNSLIPKIGPPCITVVLKIDLLTEFVRSYFQKYGRFVRFNVTGFVSLKLKKTTNIRKFRSFEKYSSLSMLLTTVVQNIREGTE